MTTGINNWITMELPEVTVDDVYFGDHPDADDLRPVKSGPFAVSIGGDDDEVLYFRSARAAGVFAANYIDAPAQVEGFIGSIEFAAV